MKKLAPYTEIVSRRRALALFGATATLLGCGGGGSGSSGTTAAASASGLTRFTTIYPGWYSGRITPR